MLQLRKRMTLGFSEPAKKTGLYAALLIIFVGLGVGTIVEKNRRHDRLQSIVSAINLADVTAAFQSWNRAKSTRTEMF